MSGSAITPWVVGNWKMNPMRADAKQLVQELKQLLQNQNIEEAKCHIGVAPVALALEAVQTQFSDCSRAVSIFAQDLSRIAGTGAYTGEISAELLKDSKIEYVLIDRKSVV